jgi:hypothetical protein
MYMLGGSTNIPVHAYYIENDDSALFIGDPVVLTGESNPLFQNRKAGTLPEITKCTAGDDNAILGAIVEFLHVEGVSESTLHNPANTARIALVADDSKTVFRIQSEGTVAAANVGQNTNVIFTHTGDTVTGYSGVEANDTLGTTATYQLKIRKVAERHLENDENVIGDNTELFVTINRHQLADITLGV